MKAPKNLGLLAILLFVGSFFLPAYGDLSGFACFGWCWGALLGHDTEILSGAWFYYSDFVLANVLFIGLAVALFATKKSRRLRSIISVVIFLQVLSWLALHIFSGQPSQVVEIKLGYYVWVIAYGLLVAANLKTQPAKSPGAIPLAHSAA